MKEIIKLKAWATSISTSFKKLAAKSQGNHNLTNIYMGRAEWIDYELIPKLEKMLIIPPVSKEKILRDKIKTLEEKFSKHQDADGRINFKAISKELRRLSN